MLGTEQERKTIDSCRFCWMCRHICPIGNVTGRERNNARARALTLSMVLRGTGLTEDITANVYECALCRACTKECATGWDPIGFTKAARLEAAIAGVTPPYIRRLIENIEKTGNPYGMTEISGELKKAIEAAVAKNKAAAGKSADGTPQTGSSAAGKGILFFLGTDARYKSPKSAINAIKLLKSANTDFDILEDEPDSGYMMDFLLGKIDETSSIMKKTAETLNGYDTVIVYDPSDSKVFMREYKEWGIGLKAKIRTFTSFLAELFSKGPFKPVKSKISYTFQDPAHLARDLEETEDARTVLEACGIVKEMQLNRKDTMWAGNLIMNEYMPEVIRKTASERWKNAHATGADVLVTACPSEYEVLAAAGSIDRMKLQSIEEVLLGSVKKEA